MTTRVLRTIDKCGGLDEYVLGEKPARIKELGMLGWSLRWSVMGTDWYANRMREEIARMNLPPEVASRLLRKDQGDGDCTTIEEHITKVDEQLEESDEKCEEAVAMTNEVELGPNERESATKEEAEKEADEERIIVEQSPSQVHSAGIYLILLL